MKRDVPVCPPGGFYPKVGEYYRSRNGQVGEVTSVSNGSATVYFTVRGVLQAHDYLVGTRKMHSEWALVARSELKP